VSDSDFQNRRRDRLTYHVEDERLETTGGRWGIVSLQRFLGVGDRRRQLGKEPAVKRTAIGYRYRFAIGVEPVEPRVIGKEPVRVPQD